jgi:hypothetical protein
MWNECPPFFSRISTDRVCTNDSTARKKHVRKEGKDWIKSTPSNPYIEINLIITNIGVIVDGIHIRIGLDE